MTVLSCAGGCPRLISVSAIPSANPDALADPKNWAVNYSQCQSCSESWCDRCQAKLASTRCPRCQRSLTHHYVTDGFGQRPSPSSPSTPLATTPPRRGWTRRSRPPRARTFAEAQLFMELSPCTCGGKANLSRVAREIEVGGVLAPIYSHVCASCGSARKFVFRVSEQEDAPGVVRFGDGTPSELLDPGEWLWVADRFSSVPAVPSWPQLRHSRLYLSMAVAAMDEVLAFVPAGRSEVPTKAFRSEQGRAIYTSEPGRFCRARLQVVRDTYWDILGKMDGRPKS